jgi:hypothetical protein
VKYHPRQDCGRQTAAHAGQYVGYKQTTMYRSPGNRHATVGKRQAGGMQLLDGVMTMMLHRTERTDWQRPNSGSKLTEYP